MLISSAVAQAKHLGDIRVGVLSYGTVNWEMDTIKFHGIDHANGVNLVPVKITSKNAAAIALQSGAVDMILTDIFWVIKQKGDYVIQPTHKLTGGIYAKEGVRLEDIKSLGVAGGANDKNLLVLKAYHERRGQQMPEQVKFAAPPLLNELAIKGQFDAAMNFWHYNARLDANGFTNILPTSHMLNELGIEQSVPLLGWVFKQAYSEEAADAVDAFLEASKLAKQKLLEDDNEWARLRPIMRVETDSDFSALKTHYKETVLFENADVSLQATKDLFVIVKNLKNQTVFPPDFVFPDNLLYRQSETEIALTTGAH